MSVLLSGSNGVHFIHVNKHQLLDERGAHINNGWASRAFHAIRSLSTAVYESSKQASTTNTGGQMYKVWTPAARRHEKMFSYGYVAGDRKRHCTAGLPVTSPLPVPRRRSCRLRLSCQLMNLMKSRRPYPPAKTRLSPRADRPNRTHPSTSSASNDRFSS